MKRHARALITFTAVLGLVTAGIEAEARADSKQACSDAYDKTQSLREHGQLIEARKQAVACSVSTCSAYVIKECLQWLNEIDASLPTVVFAAEDAAGADTVAVRVTVDGHAGPQQLDGKAVSLDPGEHMVKFEMTGEAAIEQKVLIRQGEKNRNVSASFKKASSPAAPRVAPEVPVVTAPRAGGVPAWAWVSGGVGVVALGVSAGFGASALGAQSKLATVCGDIDRCPASKRSLAGPLADQRTLDRNVFLGVGAVAVVGIALSIVGIATAPQKSGGPQASLQVAPYASPVGAGVTLQAGF
jgi:hypothetical protein